jgi:meso-butanediol dehydrogenase/(S,S)-butanediol dehydrogenase/diacetyl reductase
MRELEGKIALVTGASRGIGLSTAKLLTEKGAKVYTAQRSKGEHFWLEADFNDLKIPKKILSQIQDLEGHLDILVNNAGIMREGNAEETTETDWFEQLQINLTVPFLLIKYALPMLKVRKGSIINVGSIEGLGSNPRHPAYCASKGGLHALTRAVAVDHGPEGVRCNAVAPGWINTELNEEFIKSLSDPKVFKNKIGEIHPLKRSGEPLEVAELIVWLASEKASFLTGQVLTVDGGRTAKLSLP